MRRPKPRVLHLLPGLICAAGLTGATLSQMAPVEVTGFNADIVVEASASPPFGAFATPFDGGNNAWYERGLPGSAKGLPAGGAFASIADPTVQVQLQPYTQNNALLLSAAVPSGELQLAPAAQVRYGQLAIIASSANGGGTGTMVIFFGDGSVSPAINFNAQDWFNVTANNALNNLGRTNLVNSTIDDASLNNPRLYHTSVNLAALGLSGQPIVSITFNKPAASGSTAVLAVSGQRAVTALTPIDATGWNRDVVVENTAAAPYGSFASSFDTFNNISWYEAGLPGTTKGLPAGGAFASLANPLIQGQFRPYDQPNALFLDVPGPAGDLTLAAASQRPYDFLAIFAASSNQGGLGSMVVHFTDGSSSPSLPLNAQDWFNVTTNNALNNLGRMNLNSSVADDASAGNPRVYQTVVDLAARGLGGRAVSRITFTKPAVGGASQNTVIMGISGQAAAGVTGACTFADGTCGLLPMSNCLAAGGTFAGDGTSCPLTGACIAASGDCSIRNAANCAFIAGAYQGDGSPCPAPGACIAPSGNCTQLNSFQCAFQGGTFQGSGSPCPAPGGCCMAASCVVLNSFQCAFQGGSFLGAGTACDITYPSIGPGGGAFEDISFSGTQITVWTGSVDDGFASIPVGFSFPFFGSAHTQAFVGTNGLITFGAGSTTFANVCVPAPATPNNAIYPLWDDYHLHAGHTGRVFYQTLASPTRLVVQWDLVGHYNAGAVPIDQSTFQAVLFENGNIEFRYGPIAPVPACGPGGAGATVGLENAGGTAGLSYDNTLLGSGPAGLAVAAMTPCAPAGCRADFNGDGDINPDDLSDYITCFFTNAAFPGACPEADFNQDGSSDPDDLSDYITLFFTVTGGGPCN